MNSDLRATLPDHASDIDPRGLAIDQVGIRDLRWPVQVMDRAQTSQGTVVKLDISVGLPADKRGTHMSRIVECLEASGGELTLRTLPDLLTMLQRRLEADSVHLVAEFPYFVRKTAPVSGVPSWMDIDATFKASKQGDSLDFALTVDVPVTSLCPCSKAISAYGAHNQRSRVSVTVQGSQMVWIEDVADAIDRAASAPVYALLKREDEKFVTEQAYDNPRFVEDMVRDVALEVRRLEGVTDVEVIADNFESIHNHNAWARLRWSSASGTPASGRPTLPPGRESSSMDFGGWLREQRQLAGLSQAALADAAGITGSLLSRVERGERSLSTDALERTAGALGLDAEQVSLRAGELTPKLRAEIAADPEAFLRWAQSRRD